MGAFGKYRRRAALYSLAASLVFSTIDSAAWARAQADPAPAAPVATPAATVPTAPASTGPVPTVPVPAKPVGPTPEGLDMPDLAFTETAEIIDGYDKFFYFHRGNTSFAEAYNDIRECEGLANGSNIYMGNLDYSNSAMMAGGLPGLAGGIIGGLLVDAIFGAAQRRKEKRIKIRNCMGFKDYQRYGLPKDLWKKLNAKPKKGDPKQTPDYSLRLRALIASGPVPAQKVLPK